MDIFNNLFLKWVAVHKKMVEVMLMVSKDLKAKKEENKNQIDQSNRKKK